jgi:hypothetical protein
MVKYSWVRLLRFLSPPDARLMPAVKIRLPG